MNTEFKRKDHTSQQAENPILLFKHLTMYFQQLGALYAAFWQSAEKPTLPESSLGIPVVYILHGYIFSTEVKQCNSLVKVFFVFFAEHSDKNRQVQHANNATSNPLSCYDRNIGISQRQVCAAECDM